MIRVEIDDVRFQNNRNTKYILYADTRNEVPATGAATAAIAKYGDHGEHNFTGEITTASAIYTADGAFAILNSSDNWCWESGSSGGGGGGSTVVPNVPTTQSDPALTSLAINGSAYRVPSDGGAERFIIHVTNNEGWTVTETSAQILSAYEAGSEFAIVIADSTIVYPALVVGTSGLVSLSAVIYDGDGGGLGKIRIVAEENQDSTAEIGAVTSIEPFIIHLEEQSGEWTAEESAEEIRVGVANHSNVTISLYNGSISLPAAAIATGNENEVFIESLFVDDEENTLSYYHVAANTNDVVVRVDSFNLNGDAGKLEIAQFTQVTMGSNHYNCSMSLADIMSALTNGKYVIGRATSAYYPYDTMWLPVTRLQGLYPVFEYSDFRSFQAANYFVINWDPAGQYWLMSHSDANLENRGAEIYREWDDDAQSYGDWTDWSANYNDILVALNNGMPVYLTSRREWLNGESTTVREVYDRVLLTEALTEDRESDDSHTISLAGTQRDGATVKLYSVTVDNSNAVQVTTSFYTETAVCGVTTNLGLGVEWTNIPPASVAFNGSLTCSYSVDLTVAEQSNVVVMMGSNDITSTAYDGNGNISINTVTDDVYINITTNPVNPITYSVYFVPNNVDFSDNSHDALEGEGYYNEVSPRSGTLQSVTVYMNGVDVTSTAWYPPEGGETTGAIDIDSVSGDIYIFALGGASGQTFTITDNSGDGVIWDHYVSTLNAGQGTTLSYHFDPDHEELSVMVTMNGTDITDMAYLSSGSIYIPPCIGNVTIMIDTESLVQWVVDWTLSSVTADEQPSDIVDGDTLGPITLTPNNGGTVDCTITMGGDDVTSQWYTWDAANSKGIIQSTGGVTGDIEIVATEIV